MAETKSLPDDAESSFHDEMADSDLEDDVDADTNECVRDDLDDTAVVNISNSVEADDGEAPEYDTNEEVPGSPS